MKLRRKKISKNRGEVVDRKRFCTLYKNIYFCSDKEVSEGKNEIVVENEEDKKAYYLYTVNVLLLFTEL